MTALCWTTNGDPVIAHRRLTVGKPPDMERRITGFHQDAEGQWVAELECGHTRHVRHEPPWTVRDWVLSPEGRASRLGSLVECLECGPGEEEEPSS